MRLALFDLDNTLLGGDSDHAWGDYLCERGILDGAAYKARNDAFYQDYLAGTLNLTGELYGTGLDVTLAGVDQAKAEEIVAEAHKVCPYSNATRGNVDVTLSTHTR